MSRSMVTLILLATLTTTSAHAGERTPVEVAPMTAPAGDAAAALLAERLTDTLARALNASGRFVVVRADLAAEVRAAQKRYLSAFYEEGEAPQVGHFLAARVLVKASLRKHERGGLAVEVAFVDLETLATLPELTLSVRAAAGQQDTLATELMVAVAERAARAAGAGQGLDAKAKAQMAQVAGGSLNLTALDLHTEGRRLARSLTYRGLLGAVEKYQAALRLDPRFALAQADLAEAESDLAWLGVYSGESHEQQMGHFERAQAAAEAALRLEPGSAVVQRVVCEAYVRAGRRDQAEAALQKAQAANPDDPGTLALAATLSTSHLEKVTLLKRAVALDPQDVSLRLQLIEVYSEAGDQERTYEAYVAALMESDPRHPVLLANLASELVLSGRADLARQLVEQALERAPELVPLYLDMAELEELRGRSPDRYLAEALERGPEAALAFQPPPSAFRAAHERRAQQMEQAVLRFPRNTLTAVSLAKQLAESSDEDTQARGLWIFRDLEREGRIKPGDIYSRFFYAKALGRTGAYAEAAEILADLHRRADSRRLKQFLRLAYVDALMGKADYSKARTELARIIERAETRYDRAVAQQRLARTYRQESEADLARRVLQEARAAHDMWGWIDVDLAMLLRDEHAWAAADARRAKDEGQRRAIEARRDALATRTMEAWARALDKLEGAATVYGLKASFAWDVGKRAEAIAALERAVTLDAEWLPTLAGRLYAEGRAQEAEERLNAAIAADPGNHVLASYRGDFFKQAGQPHRAGLAYADAYHLRPSQGYLLAAVSAFEGAGEQERGIRLLQEALAEHPEAASDLHNRIAAQEASRGRYDAAMESLLLAKRASRGKSFIVQKNLAYVYRRLGRAAQSAAAYEEALMINQKYAAIYVDYADLLVEDGKASRAQDVLTQGLEALPQSRDLRMAMLGILGASAPDRCAEVARRSAEWLADDPGFGGYLREQGRCLVAEGKGAEAVTTYREAIRLSPDDGKAYRGLAEAHRLNGQLGQEWGALAVVVFLEPQDDAVDARITTLKSSGAQLELPERIPDDMWVALVNYLVDKVARGRTQPGVTGAAPPPSVNGGLISSGVLLLVLGGIAFPAGIVADDRTLGTALMVGGLGGIATGSGLMIAALFPSVTVSPPPRLGADGPRPHGVMATVGLNF
jgi:tetratricopeptide (TPR) repeat protein